MKIDISSLMTPQKVAISKANRFGNKGLKKQQGTTRTLYDSLEVDGREVYQFFKGANNRDFPFTNVGASGNRLDVGELVVVERMYLSLMTINPVTDEVLSIESLDSLVGAGLPSLGFGDMDLKTANSTVIKELTAVSFLPQFNKNADWDGSNNFELDTQIVLQPLLEYVWEYRVAPNVAIANTFLRLTYEGVGAIIAPRQTF